ncbi:MAG: phosphatase PAP2 family protein [Planctomycetales bacterium]|nr:phosphatase PAP2 family protein [Planctomycetales bacterium]
MTTEDLRVDIDRSVAVFVLLVVAGLVSLSFDMPLARACATEEAPRELQAILDRVEVFGHAYGVAVTALTIWFVAPAKRVWLPRFLAASYGAGLMADIGKLTVWRYRPCSYDLSGSVADSFVGSIFTTSGQHLAELVQSSHHSLPSAHTATAVAAAMILGRIYPHARGWFVTLAVLVAANRIEGCAHFASDVCWGAAVGYATQAVVASGGMLTPALNRLEYRIMASSKALVTTSG